MNNKIIGGIVAIVVIAVAITAFSLEFNNVVPADTTTEPKIDLANEKLGLIVNTPSAQLTVNDLVASYDKAKSTNIGRNNVYMFWSIVEPTKNQYDWSQTDPFMSLSRNNDLKVTLYFSVINGRLLGPFPEWMGNPSFDKTLENNLVDVLDATLSRYNIVDTVIISGETDIHFRNKQADIPQYKEFFTNVYDRIKEKHPDVKIGNAFSLHGILEKDLEYTINNLNDVGDFIGFTYFPVDRLNDISKTPVQAISDLEQTFDLSNGKPIGFFEISWSTSDSVKGNQQDQTDFITLAYDFYRENETMLEFFTWYRQYDRPDGTCTIISDTLDSGISLGGGSGIGSSEFVVERLGQYICNAGLIDTNDNPKPSWSEFDKQIQLSINS